MTEERSESEIAEKKTGVINATCIVVVSVNPKSDLIFCLK